MTFHKNDRLLRKKILNFFLKIKIKSINLTFSKILILTWISLNILSIFMPWFSLPYNDLDSQTAFSRILWITGYLIILSSVINLFLIFSTSLKKKLKLFLNLTTNEKNLILIINSILLLIIINSALTIKWLNLFSNDIVFYTGITISITATLIMVLWSYMNYLKNEDNYWNLISVNESHSETINIKKDDKIKLPF